MTGGLAGSDAAVVTARAIASGRVSGVVDFGPSPSGSGFMARLAGRSCADVPSGFTSGSYPVVAARTVA